MSNETLIMLASHPVLFWVVVLLSAVGKVSAMIIGGCLFASFWGNALEKSLPKYSDWILMPIFVIPVVAITFFLFRLLFQ